ncbi:MAG: zinc ribbon domain-containing protein, partial [Clostridia bacterium]|nr:zinc ribbon domain-containing protein [Clostridia bacterium]
MAKFCSNCGAALGEGAAFCPACGAPSMQAAPQPQQPPAQPPQKQYTPRPQVHIPEQFAQKNAAKAQAKAQSGAPAPRKKGKGGLVALIVILLVA